MAGRPKGIVTQAMVTSAKKRLQETGTGHTVTLSQGKWLHFGTHGVTLHQVGDYELTKMKRVNRWQEKTVKQINDELRATPWRP